MNFGTCHYRRVKYTKGAFHQVIRTGTLQWKGWHDTDQKEQTASVSRSTTQMSCDSKETYLKLASGRTEN